MSSNSVSASNPSSESGEDTEDPVHPNIEWTVKNWQVWSPSNTETLRNIQAPTGMMSEPTRYAISRIHDVASSFHLFFTLDLIQLIQEMTNLHGRCSISGWSDVDAQEILTYMGLHTWLVCTGPKGNPPGACGMSIVGDQSSGPPCPTNHLK